MFRKLMIFVSICANIVVLFSILAIQQCSATTLDVIPCPHHHYCLRGIDPQVFNPYLQNDHGFKNKIFQKYEGGNSWETYQFSTAMIKDGPCDFEFETIFLKNYQDYQRERDTRFLLKNTYFVMHGGYLPILDEGINRTHILENDLTERKIQNFFSDTIGEIIQTKVKCVTKEINNSPFLNPTLTKEFMLTMTKISEEADKASSDKRDTVLESFVNLYGTHFMTKIQMGAEIIFQKLYTKNEINPQLEVLERECIKISADSSLRKGMLSKFLLNEEFYSASKACGRLFQDEEYFEHNDLNSSRVIVVGALPRDHLSKWHKIVSESPKPIYMELEKISSVVFNPNLDTSSYEKPMNRTSLYMFLEEISLRYCEIIYKKPCLSELIGCGINSQCAAGTKCINDGDTPEGYRCEETHNYGAVIITGGLETDRLNSVASIGTWQLPALPHKISSHTLSQVGSKLYQCGGYNKELKNSDFIYIYDMSQDNSEWELFMRLPVGLAGHTAVTFGYHIWITGNNHLYDIITKNKVSRTYKLPFVVSRNHCAVSNDTHSYIIGAGSEQNEIWVNTHANSPVDWQFVTYLSTGRVRHGCLWFGNNIFIAGGGETNYTDTVELFDTETNLIVNATPLSTPRREVVMFVLDGEAAIAGGRANNGLLDTIETYDINTLAWKMNERKLDQPMEFFALIQLVA